MSELRSMPFMKSPIRLRVACLVVAVGGMLPVHSAQSGSVSLFSAGFTSPRPVAAASVAGSNSAYTVIASGLLSPRGLTFGTDDRLYVAEAGLGGTAEDPVSYTGAIDEILNPQSAHPHLRGLVSGLASVGDQSEGEIIGVGGISVSAQAISAIIGESEEAIGAVGFGQLLKVKTSANVKVEANVGSVDYRFTAKHPDLDPGGQYPDANPYGVLTLPGHTYVVDAGSNTLDEVLPGGKVKILAYFENNVTSDSTPTCMAQGPDGALYIGTLSLVDSLVLGPSAKIYRVDPSTLPAGGIIIGSAFEWATGLWPINGCAFGPDGTFYASELITSSDFTGGDVVKIPFNDPSSHISLTNQTLPLAAGVAVASDGTVYAVGLTAYNPSGFVARLALR